jgi:hypothetical protein
VSFRSEVCYYLLLIPADLPLSKSVPFDTALKAMRSYYSVGWEGLMIKPHYAWREQYVCAVLETDPSRKFSQIYEAVAAIEQRRLSPVETEHERLELENAWEGVRTLISESSLRLV